MNRYPMWKNILVAVMILIGLIYTIPNFFGESPAVQITPAKSTTKLDSALLGKVEDIFKQEKIEYDGVYQDARGVKARFKSTDTQIRAKDVLQANLGSDYTVALNLLSRSPNWLRSLGAKPMYLGLDLRGGVHFLMQVDMKAALSKAAERFVGDFKIALRKERISYVGVSREGEAVQIRFNNAEELTKAHAVIAKEYPNLTLEESAVGEERILKASLNLVEQKSIQDFAIKQNIQTLHNRINELGVAEPIIQQQGADRVVVQLPGVQDTAKAKEILGRTATLEIRMVDEEKSDAATLEKADKGQAPLGDDVFKNRDGRAVLVKKNVVLTGDYITDAGPGVDGQSGRSTVNVTLDARGARIFQQVTRENVGKRMAILLIEKGSTEVITAPTINEEIGGGRVQISGMANTQEATDIALLLRAGALAAPMDIIEERTVGPSMGQDNINRGVHSTLWGFAAIAVMMMIYYVAFGAVSVTALAINLLLLVAILSMLQATLTLPGLANVFVKSCAMATRHKLAFMRVMSALGILS
jgi:preprotein translocase subunit SecD